MNGILSFAPRYNLVVLGLSLTISAGLTSPLRADDFPKPIEPPKSSTLTPIEPVTSSPPIAPTGTTPIPGVLPDAIGKAGQPSSAPKPVDAAHRHIPPLIDQMLDGKLTPQRAWDEKLLSVDDLLWIFTDYIDPWGSFRWKFNNTMRRGLAKLLAENATDKLQTPKKLSPTVRLWLEDYYGSINDEKCFTMGESILSDIKTPIKVKGESPPIVILAIERMAWLYVTKQQNEKCAQTWLRFPIYCPNDNFGKADAYIEAARAYVRAGDDKKAEELCNQVPLLGNGWSSGMAIWDRASNLISQENHEKARTLLKEPLTGVGASESRVGLLTALAYSYYRTDEFDLSRKACEDAIALFATLSQSLYYERAQGRVNVAKEILRSLDRWQGNSRRIVCENISNISVVAPVKQTVKRQIAIRSFKPLHFVARSKDPQITIQPVERWQINDTGYFYQNIFEFSIAPTALLESFSTSLTIKCSELPNYEENVPLQINVIQNSVCETCNRVN